MILVDLIIIAIMALCILLGYKRGLIGVAFKILSFILAIVITFILYIPVSNFVINNTSIDDSLKNAIVERFSEEDITEEKIEKESSMPQVITEYIEKTTADVKNASLEIAAQNISITLVKLMVAILLFILIRILLMFIKLFTNIVEKLPIIKQFNKVGGIIYGFLQGSVIIFVVLAIISIISPIVNTSAVLGAINSSYIGSILYNNNILLSLIF